MLNPQQPLVGVCTKELKAGPHIYWYRNVHRTSSQKSRSGGNRSGGAQQRTGLINRKMIYASGNYDFTVRSQTQDKPHSLPGDKS